MNEQRLNRLDRRISSPTKAGWRVREWANDAGVSRAFVYKLLAADALRSVKAGSARIIITSPAEYLESLAKSAGSNETHAPTAGLL